MIIVKVALTDGEELEYLAESVEVEDATGDDSLRLRIVDSRTIKLDTAPM